MGYIIKADRMSIGGELVESISGAWDESINPADETAIGRVPAGTISGLHSVHAERSDSTSDGYRYRRR